MDTNIKAYDLFWNLYNNNLEFQKIITENMAKEKIRFFGSEEWEKISSQNFFPIVPEVKEFSDMFILGYNIGNCVGTSRQLSYSYNDVDIVSGTLPILKGTKNAEVEGGHCWLENKNSVIDTTLMLVIDKSLKETLGYIEEQRLTQQQLMRSVNYGIRKELVNDKSFKSRK